jgi:ABC-type lipoprotein export system ATPase subunit
MVTHELDIAADTNRNIYVRDGRIVRNERILQSLRCRLRDQKPY